MFFKVCFGNLIPKILKNLILKILYCESRSLIKLNINIEWSNIWIKQINLKTDFDPDFVLI